MDTRSPYYIPEIWGGIECTINRVNDQYRDQLTLCGHYNRGDDIDRIAALGIHKLRYPILWERHQQSRGQKIDWRWISGQLEAIRSRGMVPIAGLIHHGSGPSFTNLMDRDFPLKLAAYAREVATRFPWITYYTPVNEPLTTARFSGLYGFWYPHAKDEFSFFTMLLNQVKGVVLSMQAIREINPGAKLIPTEDLSKTHSTPHLKYQADFENERRWLTNDLLCGKVNRQHFFWDYLLRLGIPASSLHFFLENPCPPSIIGFNYYVTSERYLDENLKRYPLSTHGGNGIDNYADTEAVRVDQQSGLISLLTEAWQRYNLPLAITECHLSCSREEQMRWFKETWDSCCHLLKKGIDIRAVTAWSLFGAFDWNSLLTVHANHYEPGIFDVSHQPVRMTAMGKLIKSLSETGNFDHPVLSGQGWWQRIQKEKVEKSQLVKKNRPILLLGKTGTLGCAFIKVCQERGIEVVALGREDILINDEQSIRAAVRNYDPWAIINATGYVRVDDAESDIDKCFEINNAAPALMARICHEYGLRFMSFSSDLVFDGTKQTPYYEGDNVLPLNTYGCSKAEGERSVLAVNPESLIIRTSAFFGPWDRYNFVHGVLEALQQEESFLMANDVTVSPTYLPDLCHTALDIFIDDEQGIWHLSNDGITTWAGFGEIIAARSGYKKNKLVSVPMIEMDWKARRPSYSVLQSDRGIRLPDLHHALDRYFEHRVE